MTWFACWWNGHAIAAVIEKNAAGMLGYKYHCERCKRPLPGPRL